MPRIVVTGLGAVTPFGVGKEEFWEGIKSGVSTARLVTDLDLGTRSEAIACRVDDERFKPRDHVASPKELKLMGRAVRFAVGAASLAMQDSNVDVSVLEASRCGVALGTGGVGLHDIEYLRTMLDISREIHEHGDEIDHLEVSRRHLNPLTPLKMLPNIAAAHVAIQHGLRGENVTVCTACTSGTQAVGEAIRLMRLGHADLMLAGGADAMINPMGILGFGMLGVLSSRVEDPERASRPFDRTRDGFVMGEGAAVLILETLEHARRRGASILAELIGYGACSDAFRITDEREDGAGCIDAMERALADASIDPSQVDYVNAHGTGTPMNDRTEILAIKKVFGSHSERLLVSSTKSQIGHLVAAAGAAELVACVQALQHQTAPPTINYEHPDPECDLDVVPNEARAAGLDIVISNSFGFGGQNACIVLRRADAS